jgi:hypothetical protein
MPVVHCQVVGVEVEGAVAVERLPADCQHTVGAGQLGQHRLQQALRQDVLGFHPPEQRGLGDLVQADRLECREQLAQRMLRCAV